MISRRGLASRALLVLVSTASLRAGEIAPAGERLARMLDATQVERLWLPGQPIHWRTGTFNPRGHQSATHCSAFVAAVCERLRVEILRPPEHSQVLLANAQNEWLKTVGLQYGWRRVRSPEAAQQFANRGWLVVVSYRNPHHHKPGHIAIVRPSDKSDALLADEGPQIIQAGALNANSVSLRRGFAHHPDAWKGHGVDFFAHAIGDE